MAVLGFDLSPLRDAIDEMQQGVRQGVQDQQQGGGDGDYLGYLRGLAPQSQAPAWQALGQVGQHIAPALGSGPATDFLGQLSAYAAQNPGLASPSFNLLGNMYQGGLSTPAAMGGTQKTWDDLSAYANALAATAQQQAQGRSGGAAGWSDGGGGTGGGGDFGQGGGTLGGKVEPDVARWDGAARAATAGTDIDPDVLLALMTNESHGVPTAHNADAGALGLLQLLPENFRPGEDWADPETNLRVAVRLMQQKIADIKRTYAANGINRTGKAFWTDVAQAWLGTFDYNTGGWTGAVDANGFGAQDQARVFGANYDAIKAGRQQAPAGGGGSGPLNTLFGGAHPAVMQEFGRTPYSVQHPQTYGYGAAYGLAGDEHPGVDYGMPYGSRLYVPVNGTVSLSGGTGYYQNDRSGNAGGTGELMITLANGDQLIMGHMSSINLTPGQQVNAGTFAGLSGGSDGDHLHLEVRQRQSDGSYRIVDPRIYFGAAGG